MQGGNTGNVKTGADSPKEVEKQAGGKYYLNKIFHNVWAEVVLIQHSRASMNLV